MEGYQRRRRVASFRGVPFDVYLGSQRKGGKRLDVHEFKGRDIPWAEEMGRKYRIFSVRGATIGEDHDLNAERLEEEFERHGAGELILPHRQPILVQVADFVFHEPDDRIGVQPFEVEFVEFGQPSAPEARPNTSGEAQTLVETVFDVISDRFSAVFTTSDQSTAATSRTLKQTDAAARKIGVALERVKSEAGALEEVARTADQVGGLAQTFSNALADPAAIAASVKGSLESILALAVDPLHVFSELSPLTEFGDVFDDPGSATVTRASFKRNQEELVSLIRLSAIAARAKALSLAEFKSSTGAAAYRDEIAGEIDEAILRASDAFADDSAAAFRRLRTASIRDLDTRGARLPARVQFVTPFPMPAILVAQRLYGNPFRESEIVERNAALIYDPGRIPAGTALEVLVDG